MRKLNKISIIVPVYFNADSIRPLYEDIKKKIFDKVDYQYELIFVNDGSLDNSGEVIEELVKEHDDIIGIHLSRNFGSHAAILCGLAHCSGDCAVVKAADMQEPTEMILNMINEWEAEYNVVLAVRTGREEPFFQSAFANLYYWMVKKFALSNMPKGGFDVYLLDRKVIEVLKNLDERNSALTGQILWSGFKTKKIYYTRKAREIGKSRWTLAKKIRLVTDTMFSFSALPITIVSSIGFLSIVGGLLWAFVVLIFRLTGRIEVSGWTTLFIFNLCSFGIVMMTLGILGSYLWRTFDASRSRPSYIIEKINIKEKDN